MGVLNCSSLPGSQADSSGVVLVTFLWEKLQEAISMDQTQHDAWVEFNNSTEATLWEKWEKLSTKLQLVNGKWSSVFLLQDKPSTLDSTPWGCTFFPAVKVFHFLPHSNS
jgi:hypothetical protein